jgi:hypothetical protein
MRRIAYLALAFAGVVLSWLMFLVAAWVTVALAIVLVQGG